MDHTDILQYEASLKQHDEISSKYAVSLNGAALSVSFLAIAAIQPENTFLIILPLPLWIFFTGLVFGAIFMYVKTLHLAIQHQRLIENYFNKSSLQLQPKINETKNKLEKLQHSQKINSDEYLEISTSINSIENGMLSYKSMFNKFKIQTGIFYDRPDLLLKVMHVLLLSSITLFLLGCAGMISGVKPFNNDKGNLPLMNKEIIRR